MNWGVTLQNSFDIDSSQAGHAILLRLSGEFDLTSVEPFREEMELVKQSEPAEVIIDLQRLKFMDSTGIRMILTAQADCGSWKGRLSIVPGPPNVMKVLQIAGVDTRLNVVSPTGDLLEVEKTQ